MFPAKGLQAGCFLFGQGKTRHIALHRLYDPVGRPKARHAVAETALLQRPGTAKIGIDGLSRRQQLLPEGEILLLSQGILFPF